MLRGSCKSENVHIFLVDIFFLFQLHTRWTTCHVIKFNFCQILIPALPELVNSWSLIPRSTSTTFLATSPWGLLSSIIPIILLLVDSYRIPLLLAVKIRVILRSLILFKFCVWSHISALLFSVIRLYNRFLFSFISIRVSIQKVLSDRALSRCKTLIINRVLLIMTPRIIESGYGWRWPWSTNLFLLIFNLQKGVRLSKLPSEWWELWIIILRYYICLALGPH